MAIANLTNSVNRLGIGISAANSSVKSIQKTLNSDIKFQKQSIRLSQQTFFKRRDNIRRKEQEGILESRRLGGASSRMGSVIGQSSKGFLGRIADFLGAMLVAWAVRNLPLIIKTIEGVIDKIKRVAGVLKDFLTNTTNFFVNMGSVISAAGMNLITLDFADSEGRLSVAIDEMNTSFDLMGENIDSAFEILKEPIDFSELNKAAEMPEQQQQEQPAAETPRTPATPATPAPTTTAPAPAGPAVYTSQGGQKLVDEGGQDYGNYIPGMAGSRGSARVHGMGGERGHTGEDYALPIGKPLTMVAKGKVVDVGLGYNGGYGNFVTVLLDNGMYVKMAHLDKVYVKKGQRVGAGSAGGGRAVVIGTSGNTGLSGGPHLHLDYSKAYDPATALSSKTVNPKNFIENGGLVIGSNVRSTAPITSSQNTSGGGYQAGGVPKAVANDIPFQQAVTNLAQKYNLNENDLYAVMSFETGGTFDPAQKNLNNSGATGLIQFMPSTAKGLGTTTEALARMSRVEQLKYVDMYFSDKGIRGGNLDDLYMAILFPAAVGKGDDYVLFGQGAMSGYTGRAYDQNRGLDKNGDGSITKKEAAQKVIDHRNSMSPWRKPTNVRPGLQ